MVATSFRKRDGQYVVGRTTVSGDITVTAELPDGAKKTLPPKEFRIKRIPDPVVNWPKIPSKAQLNRLGSHLAIECCDGWL